MFRNPHLQTEVHKEAPCGFSTSDNSRSPQSFLGFIFVTERCRGSCGLQVRNSTCDVRTGQGGWAVPGSRAQGHIHPSGMVQGVPAARLSLCSLSLLSSCTRDGADSCCWVPCGVLPTSGLWENLIPVPRSGTAMPARPGNGGHFRVPARTPTAERASSLVPGARPFLLCHSPGT